MTLKFEIEDIQTGYLITIDGEKYAYNSVKDILDLILDNYDRGSRHDEKRVYIIEAPGDKHERFTTEHSNVIWPEGD